MWGHVYKVTYPARYNAQHNPARNCIRLGAALSRIPLKTKTLYQNSYRKDTVSLLVLVHPKTLSFTTIPH